LSEDVGRVWGSLAYGTTLSARKIASEYDRQMNRVVRWIKVVGIARIFVVGGGSPLMSVVSRYGVLSGIKCGRGLSALQNICEHLSVEMAFVSNAKFDV